MALRCGQEQKIDWESGGYLLVEGLRILLQVTVRHIRYLRA